MNGLEREARRATRSNDSKIEKKKGNKKRAGRAHGHRAHGHRAHLQDRVCLSNARVKGVVLHEGPHGVDEHAHQIWKEVLLLRQQRLDAVALLGLLKARWAIFLPDRGETQRC